MIEARDGRPAGVADMYRFAADAARAHPSCRHAWEAADTPAARTTVIHARAGLTKRTAIAAPDLAYPIPF